MRVLFAAAELTPVAAVGGLAQAAAGIVHELRRQGVEVDVVLPDYGDAELSGEEVRPLDVPGWAAPARARRGVHADAGRLHLVSVPGMARPHPYLQADGTGWSDNDARFFAFSAAVAALREVLAPDVLHLNDWHTAAVAALDPTPPTVLSIHNLAYQGAADASWLERLGPAPAWDGACNPLAGGIRLADRIVVVSPTYREEILRPELGCGLDGLLRTRTEVLHGIRNGIDTDVWNPLRDPFLPVPFGPDDLGPKRAARDVLRARLGLPVRKGPLVVSVTRLTPQKGIDLLLPILSRLEELPVQLAILGTGDAALAAELRAAAAARPATLAFVDAYDEALAHLLFAGGDLLVMPSRFEPCGLTQMQAMRYGTLPVVTDVGGLHDTVVDLEAHPSTGTGWKASSAGTEALLEALTRAARGWREQHARVAAQRRAMTADWSWREPAARHVELYRSLAEA
jgi:starch synthase